MSRTRIFSLLFVVLVASATSAFAAPATPLVATFLDKLAATGVSDDGNPAYANGVQGVRCYFGVNGRNANLITYNTPRKLHFTFDPSSPAWRGSGLPQADFLAEVDLYGVNYFGSYQSMGIGTTAQVQMDVEFHVGNSTYELDYRSLAAKRISVDTWLITSNPLDIGGNPGFAASSAATLNVIRHRTKENFGSVNMPIRVEVKLQ